MPQFLPRVTLLLIVALLPGWPRAASATAPNVILIVTDEHNFRTLGCYRKLLSREQAEMWGPKAVVPTPHLDSLAKAGVLCTRAYATSPVCSPCRATIFTGRYSYAAGVPTNSSTLDRSIPTLADRLNGQGYQTAYIGKWHLGGNGRPEWSPKVDGGFQHKKFMFNRGHWKQFRLENGVPSVAARKDDKPTYDVKGADKESFSTDWLTDRAIDFITESDATKPFFTVISYPDPHGPNTVRPPYDHRFDSLRFIAPRTYRTGIPAPKWLGSKIQHHEFRGASMSSYFGMVQCIDDNVGRLLKHLETSGKLDNTLIIMTSDHGDLCYEHDRNNKGNPFEGSARVPMILRLPKRIAAGQVYKQPMGTVDLTPTVMGLLNLPGDPKDQGRDLSAELVDISQTTYDAENPPITFLRSAGSSTPWVAAVDARYKLVVSEHDVPWLFDRVDDPDELLNYYRRPGTDGVAERLGKALREYGVANKDPHLSKVKISASLDRVLGTEVKAK
ncbi:MAG: sulfatase [Pirellulaceae bacterium]|nr:sulfatase [Pirellulaceae bacterium]